jgi:hypothetical protein
MQKTRAKSSSPANAKRSFTWGIRTNDVGWTKPGAATEGSSASDCIAGSVASLSDKPRRKKPASTGAT